MTSRRPMAIALLLHIVAAAFAMVGLLFGGTHAPRTSFGAHATVTAHHGSAALVAVRHRGTTDVVDARKNAGPRTDADPHAALAWEAQSIRILDAGAQRLAFEPSIERVRPHRRGRRARARSPPRARL